MTPEIYGRYMVWFMLVGSIATMIYFQVWTGPFFGFIIFQALLIYWLREK